MKRMKPLAVILSTLLLLTALSVTKGDCQAFPDPPPMGMPPAQQFSPGLAPGPGIPQGFEPPPGPAPGPTATPDPGSSPCGICPVVSDCEPKCWPAPLGGFYAGYLTSSKGARYTRIRRPDAGLPNLIYRMPLQGAWLGLSANAMLSESFGVMASGGLLIPARIRGGDLTEKGTVTIPITADLDAEQNWGILDAAALYNYSWSCCLSFQLLSGWRWDHFESRQFVQESGSVTGGPSLSQSDTNNLTVNAYIPYIGAQVFTQGNNTRFNARVIGFPLVGGDVQFQEASTGVQGGTSFSQGGGNQDTLTFVSSYFLEVFMAGGFGITPNISLGGFLRWDLLAAKTNFGNYSLANSTAALQSFDEKITLHREAWTLGGLVALDVNWL